MKFSVKDFFSKCDHKKSLMENFIFCAVSIQIPLKYNFSAALRKSTPDVFWDFFKKADSANKDTFTDWLFHTDS